MDLKTDNQLKVGDLVMIDAINAEKQDPPLIDKRKILRSCHRRIGIIDGISADHDGNIEYEIRLINHPSGSVVLKKVPRCWFKKMEIAKDKPEEILLTKPAPVATINGTCGFEEKYGCTDYTDYSKMYKNMLDWGVNKVEHKTPDKKYEVDHIIYNHPATIVFWKDGTKTVVKCSENDPYIRYNAFCAALAKKIYGNNSQVNKIVASGIDQGRPQKKPHGEKKDISRLLKVNKKAIEHAEQAARYTLTRSNDYREARRKAHIERITELKDKQHMAWIKIAARIGLDVEEVKKLYREGKNNG